MVLPPSCNQAKVILYYIIEMKVIVLFSLTVSVICGLITSCKSDQSTIDYGVKYNPVRKTLGLLPLKPSWVLKQKFNKDEAVWVDGDIMSVGKARHASKKIAWNGGGLLWEQDVFYSGKKIALSHIDPDAGEGWEKLIVIYHYDKPKDPWECHLTDSSGFSDISIIKANKIRAAWGL